MEKIIYVCAQSETEKKDSMAKWCGQVLGMPYPIHRLEFAFLGFPVMAFQVEGISPARAAALEEERDLGGKGSVGKRGRGAVLKNGSGRQERVRYRRTLEKVRKLLYGRGGLKAEGREEDIFILCQWRPRRYPGQLLRSFYENCRAENGFVLRAEQLIWLDGQEAGPEPGVEEPEMTFMSEIYGDYNYVTIITRREEAWQKFVETAYEEYGLSVRCTRDSAHVTFREKKTLIVDLDCELKKCCRNFPSDSVYMDLCESREKARGIAAKCGRIPLLSLHNALDTVLRDTV